MDPYDQSPDEEYYNMEEPKAANTLQDNPDDPVRVELNTDGMSDQGQKVVKVWLDEWIRLFRQKNRDYNSSALHTGDLLGARGQFAEIWRKVGKLYGPMWEDKKLENEQPREILMDLIGHCFLAIDYLNQAKIEELMGTVTVAWGETDISFRQGSGAAISKVEKHDPYQTLQEATDVAERDSEKGINWESERSKLMKRNLRNNLKGKE